MEADTSLRERFVSERILADLATLPADVRF